MSALARLRGPNNEGFLVAVIIVVVVAMALASPAFFSLNTFFALVRSSMVPLVLALGVMLVLISGGIDVSSPPSPSSRRTRPSSCCCRQALTSARSACSRSPWSSGVCSGC